MIYVLTICMLYIFLELNVVLQVGQLQFNTQMKENNQEEYYENFCDISTERYEERRSIPTDPPDQSEVADLLSRNSQANIMETLVQPNFQVNQKGQIVYIQRKTEVQEHQTFNIQNQSQPEQSDNEDNHVEENNGNTHQTDDVTQENVGGQRNSQKRQKGDNNAHKKFQTIINNVMKKGFKETLQKIKKANKGKKSYKGSKYAFTMKLMEIKKYGGGKILQQIMERFMVQSSKQFDLLGNLSKPQLYLKKMTLVFQKSFRIFVEENDIQASLMVVYDVQGFKRASCKANGLAQIKKYQKTLQQ